MLKAIADNIASFFMFVPLMFLSIGYLHVSKRSFLPLRTLKHDETLKNLEENSDAERKELNPASTSSFFNDAQQTLNKYNIQVFLKNLNSIRNSLHRMKLISMIQLASFRAKPENA